MIDIINFKGKKFDLGFSRIYYLKDFNSVEAKDEEKARKAISDRRIDFVYNLEDNKKKDKFNTRSSGLNQVFCKLARENNVGVGFNFNLVLNSDNINMTIGRMKQNVKLCRKFKVNMVLFSGAKNRFEMRAAKDMMAFGMSIGMTGSEVKKALDFKFKDKMIEEV